MRMEKFNTAPLFEPPESEVSFSRAPLVRRALASLVDLILVLLFVAFPLSLIKPSPSPSFFLSLLIFSGTVLFSYYFLGYFFLDKTLGDGFFGIKIYPEGFSLSQAVLFSLVKTIFTLVPLNLILVFMLEDNLTGEQFLFNRAYSLI